MSGIYKPEKILVCLDDGHGLETKGKRTPKFNNGTYIRENEFNHPTKEILKQELENRGFYVYDVSPERTDTTLKIRVNRANIQYKAQNFKSYIFISIHFNAIGNYWNDKVGGIETYYYRKSKRGRLLATSIHNQLLKGTNLKDRGILSAGFYVIKYTIMPAVLLECGFMTRHIEANFMLNKAYQQECASEITQGICNYFNIK